MQLRVRRLWESIRSSFWFVPGVMAVAAFAASYGMIALDAILSEAFIRRFHWLYSGSPEGAREVLSTIAGSMITVAGVSFSVVIVALTLASSQFGPRLLGNFMRDTGNQVVLGTFVATYLYCLLVLRQIRSVDDQPFVPHVAVTVGLVLAVASLGVLIYFIHHVAISIQAPHLIARVSEELHHNIETLYPAELGASPDAPRGRRADLPADFDQRVRRIEADENGYLQGTDERRVMEVATERDLIIRLPSRPGKFVLRGTVIAEVWPAERADDEVEEELREALVLGAERTPLQDVEYSMQQLVEIALRALSPSVNDPFTAITCLDRLGAALCHLAKQDLPPAERLDEAGALRVVAADYVTLRGVADTAFDQIRQNAAGHVSIRVRVLEVLQLVIGCAPDEETIAAMLHHADQMRRSSDREVPDPEDRMEIEGRYRDVLRSVDTRREELRRGPPPG